MKQSIDPSKIAQFKSMREPLGLQAAIKESNRCLLCFDAPCSQGCPAGTDPAKFIRQIKFCNYKGAARTIRNNNIMGTICSFICPVEKLCEKECSVKALEDPINISGLQRFASEYGRDAGLEPMAKSNRSLGKVAVIGAGPAGFGCAAELAKMDYDVTVFEKEDHAGGVPTWNIPGFRLPDKALAYDIDNLIGLGVEIRYNAAILTNQDVSKLLNAGYEAVFLATGLSVPYTVDMLNGYTNAVDYNTFLRKIKHDHSNIDVRGKSIAIIGGGSVAIDSAVSAKAAGASKVYLIALEHLDELPADHEEINLARLMNIIFKAGCQLTGVSSAEHRVTGLTGCEIEWQEPGIFIPQNARRVDGTEFNINVDLVVEAIGTKPGKEIQHLVDGLKTKGKGIIEIDASYETNIPGVFAGGDVVNGGATVVQAVGEGKKAARCINDYIMNRRNKL